MLSRKSLATVLVGSCLVIAGTAWSARMQSVSESARAYHWTHFLVRKDYAHPVPIPLEQVFENRDYAVFRFQ